MKAARFPLASTNGWSIDSPYPCLSYLLQSTPNNVLNQHLTTDIPEPPTALQSAMEVARSSLAPIDGWSIDSPPPFSCPFAPASPKQCLEPKANLY